MHTMIGVETFSNFDPSWYQKAMILLEKDNKTFDVVADVSTKISYFHVAAWWNDDKLLRYLLKCNLDINSQDSRGRTALMVAAQKGHIDIVKCLLKHGANVNQQSCTGVTVLAFAMHVKNKAILEKCMEFDANVNLPDELGNTWLHNACKVGILQDVTDIEKLGADINLKNKTGMTPLMISCQCGHFDVVKFLVARGSRTEAKCNDYMSALEYALYSNCPELVDYMREKTVTLSDDKGTELIIACQRGKLHEVTALLQQGEDPNYKDPGMGWFSPLHLACPKNIEIVKVLVKHGANINAKGKDWRTPLFIMCLEGNTGIVSFLLDSGANPNIRDKQGHSALMCACQNGFAGIVNLLIASGAFLCFKDHTGMSALAFAVKNGHMDILKTLIESELVNVNVQDITGLTPLMKAVLDDKLDMVQYLVEHGARIDICDQAGQNALTLAAMQNPDILIYLKEKYAATSNKQPTSLPLFPQFGDPFGNTAFTSTARKAEENILDMCANGWGYADAITFAMDKGANINCRDKDGFSPILLACSKNNMKLLPSLIQYGSDINCQDSEGWSPLMYGVKHNALITVHLLLQNGAKINLQNHQGKTALMLALEHQRFEIAECLLQETDLDVLQKDKHGQTALSYYEKYVQDGQNHILQMLLERGGQNEEFTNKLSETHQAVEHINSDSSSSHDKEAEFIEACAEGDLVKIAEKSCYYETYTKATLTKCLTLLTLNDNTGALVVLKSAGMDISMAFADGENIFFVAARTQHFPLVKNLVMVQNMDLRHQSEKGSTVTMATMDNEKYLCLLLLRYLLSLEQSDNFGVGDCKAILHALNKGIYEIFIHDENYMSYGKTCKYCTNANQAEFVLL